MRLKPHIIAKFLQATKHRWAVFVRLYANIAGLICLVFLVFVSSKGAALSTCPPDNSIPEPTAAAPVELTCLSTHFDPDSKSTAVDVMKTKEAEFRLSRSGAVNHGFQRGTLWLRTRLVNLHSKPAVVYLSLGNPLIDLARSYEIKTNGDLQKLGESGVLIAGNSKEVHDRDVVFKYSLKPKESRDILVESFAHQQSYRPMIRSANSFRSHQLLENLIFGLYFGIMLVMTLYNAFLYVVIREKMYLWYVGAIVFFHGFCFSGLLGASNYFLWPDSPVWAQRQLPVAAPLGLLFTVLFANKFLKISERSPRHSHLMKGFLAFLGLQAAASAAWFSVDVIVVGFIAQILALALTLSVALPDALAGDRPSRLFLLAWGLLIVGGLSFSLGQFGLFPHTFLTQNGILFGSSAEVILLSIALGDKINAIRIEKELSQAKEIEGAKQRALIEAEISAAHAVQTTLLPHDAPGQQLEFATCYYVAERMGGDWFWHNYDPKNNIMYFFIGDVTGHGIPSALLTGVICGAATSLDFDYARTNRAHTPTERLMHTAQVMNEAVARTGARSDRWMSMCLMSVNLTTGELLTINAGHPFPLIWRTSETRLESVVCSGPLLGHSTASFNVRTDQLNSGDKVMLFTDGYLEATESKAERPHGSRRRGLARLFSSSESSEQLIDAIRQQITATIHAHQILSDDVTVLTFRWNSPQNNVLPLRRKKTA